MITKQGAIPVEYAVDRVFNEAINSKHLPRKIGVLRLMCSDPVLRHHSVIKAGLTFPFNKLGMEARISEFEENQSIYIAGSSRHAVLGLSFDFQPTGNASSNVEYNFELELQSDAARLAEKTHGRDKTHELIGGVVLGIVNSVQNGLYTSYGPPLERPA